MLMLRYGLVVLVWLLLLLMLSERAACDRLLLSLLLLLPLSLLGSDGHSVSSRRE